MDWKTNKQALLNILSLAKVELHESVSCFCYNCLRPYMWDDLTEKKQSECCNAELIESHEAAIRAEERIGAVINYIENGLKVEATTPEGKTISGIVAIQNEVRKDGLVFTEESLKQAAEDYIDRFKKNKTIDIEELEFLPYEHPTTIKGEMVGMIDHEAIDQLRQQKPTQHFQGDISEVRKNDHQLSEKEMLEEYKKFLNKQKPTHELLCTSCTDIEGDKAIIDLVGERYKEGWQLACIAPGIESLLVFFHREIKEHTY